MSRATISTGAIAFDAPQAKRGDAPGYVLVLGDFSGSGSRGATQAARLRRVSRDNFDEVFAALDVRLQLPLCAQPLHFSELDELHPDFLYQRVDLFAELRALQRRLRDRNTFAAAAAELGAVRPAATAAAPSLDELLSAATPASSTLNVQQLIADIVAPHILPAPDPQQAQLIDAVSQTIGELMRKLMHQSAFQQLEAVWRSLYLLLRRIDGDREPPTFLLDCTPAQLPALLADAGTLDRLLQKAGHADTAPHLLLADFTLGSDAADIATAQSLADFAARRQTIAVTGGSPQLAGCSDLRASPDPADWNTPLPADFKQAWQEFREAPAAEHLFLTVPRFLLRLPYGRATSTTEKFDFEETIDASNTHYLWGNGAWLAALALLNEVAQIEQLPLHIRSDADGESLQACTEILLHDRAAARLKQSGLMPLRAVSGADTVRIPEWVSCCAAD
jgi:type VI secretion system protein ImpC